MAMTDQERPSEKPYYKPSDIVLPDASEAVPCTLCGVPCASEEELPIPGVELGQYMNIAEPDVEVFGELVPGFELSRIWICDPCLRLLDRVYEHFDSLPMYGLVTDNRWRERVPLFIEAFRDLGIYRTLVTKGFTTAADSIRMVMSEHLRIAALLKAVLEQLPDNLEKEISLAARRITAQTNRRLPPGAAPLIIGDELLGESDDTASS
jgi:hypothetical protein